MALDISTLQEYVKLHPELLTTSVRKNSIVQRFNDIRVFENETPGPHKYRIFTPVAHLQNCCATPTGNSPVDERVADIVCLLDGQEYCETDLASILRSADFRFTAGMESAGSIEEVITQGQINAFIEAIDKLIFLGDTDETDPNLNKADGLIKIATAEGIVQNATEGDIYDVIRAGIAALPVNARRGNRIAVFVGEEYGDALQGAYLQRNWYHFNPGEYAPYADLRVYGFGNVVVVPTPGLTGSNQILITPFDNIVYWTNRLNDIETLDWDYTKYHQKYYWRIKTIFGIDLKVPEWSVVINVDDAVLTNCPSCSQTVVTTTPDA